MRIARWGMGLAAVILLANSVYASDVANLKAELADLKAKVAAMESAEMAPAAGGDCASLTSMKKKGAITIGGAAEVAVIAASRDDRDQNAAVGDNDANSQDDDVDSTQFRTLDADLDFKIAASKNVDLNIKLDLDDAWGGYGVNAGMAADDDLLEEIYFSWRNIRGTPWAINFGKKEVAFGQDKDVMLLGTWTNNAGISYLGMGYEANDGAVENYTDKNPHAAVGSFRHPTELDNTFQIEAIYTWKELLKLELALFQNPASRGMNEDRAEDSLFFESYAARVTLTPLEGLSMELSFINQHQDSMGNGEDRLAAGLVVNSENDADEDQKAISFGVDYKFKGLPVELYGEYLHGWDFGYNDEYDTDAVQLGMIWGVTETIDLHLKAEWLGIDNETESASYVTGAAGSKMDEDYYSLAMGVHYKFDNGIVVGLEYMHEWYDRDSNQVGSRDIDADADVFLLGTAWSF